MASGTLAAGTAALLAGCGGDDSSSPSAKSNLSIPEDTTSEAKAGGTLKHFAVSDPTAFDAVRFPNASVWAVAPYTYPRLFKFVPGKYPKLSQGDTEGDFIESFELSPDKLQMTVKVRPEIKWDTRAPTSGRAADAQDLISSWDVYRTLNTFRTALAYDAERAPLAPVESMTAVDNRTIRIKLNKPNIEVPALFANNLNSFFIMPRESDGGFDSRRDIRGSGPWILDEFQPSARRVWRKDPNYYVKGRPFFDKIEEPVVTDYAAQLAQFKAGNIWTSVAKQEDVIQTKKDAPATRIQQSGAFGTNTYAIFFGYVPGSPFADERVRQAVSLAMDRETLIDTIGNRTAFAAEGLPLATTYMTALSPSFEGFYLDPLSKDFGPNSKYYKFDLAEAKKLLAAAGHSSLTTKFHVGLGRTDVKEAEISIGMLEAIGIKATLAVEGYPEPWLGTYSYGYAQAQHAGKTPPGRDGLTLVAQNTLATVSLTLFTPMHKNGQTFKGATVDGQNAHLGDPEINSRIEAIMAETNRSSQQELAKEFQRVYAKKAYMVPVPGFQSKNFTVNWPAIGNYGFFIPGGPEVAESQLHWWQDSTKAPLTRTS